MNDQNAAWEAILHETAASFPYPPTPDVAAAVKQRLAAPPPRWAHRRLAYAAVILLVVAGLLAVPPVRAALVNIFRAGAITIFVGPPTATPDAAQTPADGSLDPSLTASLATIAEPVTLTQAQARFPEPLQLPTLLGRPDEVWLHQGQSYAAVIFLWRDPERPQALARTLYQIDAAQYAYKGADRLETTTVDGRQAFWIEGAHGFQLQDGTLVTRQFVAGPVLVWWAEDVTFRLEGAPSLDEALRIAETLQTIAETAP
jgi:hypothetical protein